MNKNFISFIVIFASLSSLVMITNAAQRRFGMQTAPKILNTPANKTTTIFGHTSRSSSLPHLQTSKRAFATSLS